MQHLLCGTSGSVQQSGHLLDKLSRHQADGAILLALGPEGDWLKPCTNKANLVLCSEYALGPDFPCVSIDSYRAARDAMTYLLCLGHKRIGTISSENGYASTVLRMKGYKDALEEAGIPVRESYIMQASGDYSLKAVLPPPPGF